MTHKLILHKLNSCDFVDLWCSERSRPGPDASVPIILCSFQLRIMRCAVRLLRAPLTSSCDDFERGSEHASDAVHDFLSGIDQFVD